MSIITMKIYKTLHPIANIKHDKKKPHPKYLTKVGKKKLANIYGMATY